MRGLILLCLLALAPATVPAMAQEASVSVDVAADGTRTLVHELVVPAEPEAVWQAVATIEGWRSWAVPVARAVPGSDRFETNYDPAAPLGAPSGIEQQWIARDAPRSASFRTIRTPAAFPHAEAYRRVVSSFTLTPAGPGATRVRLSGTGYVAGAEGDALIGFFRAGNAIALRQLHKRFVSGPIDWSARTVGQKEE